MSTYGGDSWIPETQYRKRRVDELLGEEIADDEVRRMSNGRFACLVCLQCPVLDTMPMLHMHRRGAKHQAAAEKQLFKKQRLHGEIQKRIALGKMVAPTTSAGDERRNAPVFTATKESKARTLGNNLNVRPGTQTHTSLPKKAVSPPLTAWKRTPEESSVPVDKEVVKKGGNIELLNRRPPEVVPNHHIQHQDVQQEVQKRRQRELRLQESGWKRDGTGGWYRDENVEFDSDDETPD